MFAVFIVAVMVLLMMFMPETPRWLLAHNQRQLGFQGLQWLRGPLYDTEGEICEIENNLGNFLLKLFINFLKLKYLMLIIKFIVYLDQQEKSSFNDFLTPGLYRPLVIGTFLMVFQQFCGVNAVLFFDAKIFFSAGLTNAKAVSLSVGGAQVLATVISCLMVDKLGRRLLLMIGSISMFVCTLLLGVYYDIAEIPLEEGQKRISIFGGSVSHSVPLNHISWLAVLCVIFYIIVFSLGWGPLPWLLMSEIFPPRARGFASGIVTFVNWLLVFVVTKTFFVFFCVPETKGKSLEEIEKIFALKPISNE